MSASYTSVDGLQARNSPYGSGAPYYSESTGYITPVAPPKNKTSKWIKIGVPLFVVIVIAAVVGGVLGSRSSSKSSASSSGGGGGGGGGNSPGAASSAISVKNEIGRYATATNSLYEMPLYPSTTNTAAFTVPTFSGSTASSIAWPADPFQAPSPPSPTNVRTDRPRLIAPAYKWEALPQLIANDPYLQGWNATIFGNASDYYSLPVVSYFMDGDSGILDNARETKMRIKAFAYVYRMTNDTKWVDRAWQEIQNVAGNGTQPFGPAVDRWNAAHFLDTAEFTAAYAIAYDWMYDVWSDAQKEQIRFTMIQYGLNAGITAFGPDPTYTGWWKSNTFGNWNCVCNSGLTMGALAILGDDDSGIAEQILGLTVPNVQQNCIYAPSGDGTWTETPNYWYFGTLAHAEMASSLITATGSDQGLLTTNPNFNQTALFHMYVTGGTTLFDWGDHGPNKFSTTANGMFLYADAYKTPAYALFQREQHDAAEPNSMFWYDPTVQGAFWDGLPLDHFYTNTSTQWASMRSTWTDINALYVGIKAPILTGHQTHCDLDDGDFVIDAMGHRWAGELGSGNYRSTGYFSNETQESDRWLYYRKRTEGQNTIMINNQNQLVSGNPSVTGFGTTGEIQGSSTVYSPPSSSTAWWVADISSAYSDVTSFLRGIRMLNGRKQVLLQDDINTSGTIQWRVQTNATVTVDSSGTSATFVINDATLTMQILNAPSGAQITTGQAVRLASDPPVPSSSPDDQDQPNPTVTVVMIDLPAGQYSLQVLFNPQWPGMSSSDFVTPSAVPLTQWSTTSHN